MRFLFFARLLFTTLLIGTATASTVEQGLQEFQQGNYRAALDIWRTLSESGDARATFHLSRLYAQGKGVAQDLSLAAQYLASAAEQGDKQAQYYLGNHYNVGKWVEQSPRLAAQWWLAAAEQNVSQAQQNLGVGYLRGVGVPKDPALAWYWLNRAARNGSVSAEKLLVELETPLASPIPEASSRTGETGKPRRQEPLAAASNKSKPLPPQDVNAPRAATPAHSGNALGRTWVLRQPGEHYTLQLLASESTDAVARVRDAHKWRRQIAIYGFNNKGRRLTVMVYGRFPTLQAARAAIKELPGPLRRGPPWPRRFADIQALIR